MEAVTIWGLPITNDGDRENCHLYDSIRIRMV